MRFKCKISKVNYKEYNCIEVITIENVEEVNFKECGDDPMIEIKYYTIRGNLSYKIMPIRGIYCVDLEEQ